MGAVFSQCIIRNDNSDYEDDFEARHQGYIPTSTSKTEIHKELKASIETTSFYNPSTSQTARRVRRCLGSRITLTSSAGEIRHSVSSHSHIHVEEEIFFSKKKQETRKKQRPKRPKSYPSESYTNEGRKNYANYFRDSISSHSHIHVEEEIFVSNFTKSQETRKKQRPKSYPSESYTNEGRKNYANYIQDYPEPPIDYDVLEIQDYPEPPIDYDVLEDEVDIQKAALKISSMDIAAKYAPAKGNSEKPFKLLAKTDFLPRYNYHLSLLDWFTKGLQFIQSFPERNFEECTVIIGGKIDDKAESILFGETRMDTSVLKELRKGLIYGVILVVYFLDNNAEEIGDYFTTFDRNFPFEEGTLLFVMQNDSLVDEHLKSMLKQAVPSSKFKAVDVVAKNRTEVISRMTCVLEKSISCHLEEIRRALHELPLTEKVASSLLEVNGILRRLKQASRYPYSLPAEEDKLIGDPITDMLQSYGDKILHYGFDKDTLYIITTDISIKDKIEEFFLKYESTRIKYVITVQETLNVSFLARSGVAMHGAKFVYINNGPVAFHEDRRFATTGSLMMANGSSMVVVTSRHAFKNRENIYVFIDNTVVKLGKEMMNIHPMERLYEDITLVEVEHGTVSTVNNKCERLLIDSSGLPTPAKISSRELKAGDIVHKRGANTKFTTGVVKSVQNKALGPFKIASPYVLVHEREQGKFAAEGDSGSLVFQHSLSPEENNLDVLAMVQGKLTEDNKSVVCFPFKSGYDALKKNIPGIQSLQFYNV